MAVPTVRRTTRVLTTLLCGVFIWLGLQVVVYAHGAGASVEQSVDGYLVDIGLSEEQFVAGDMARLDFALLNEETGEDVEFSDVWLRINKGNAVVLATGIHSPKLGQTGISYMFPSAGEYQVNVRYQNNGEEIVAHTFPLTVGTGANAEESDGGLGGQTVAMGLIGVALAGLLIGFVVGKKSAV